VKFPPTPHSRLKPLWYDLARSNCEVTKMRTSRWTLLDMWCVKFEFCCTNHLITNDYRPSRSPHLGNFEVRSGQVLPKWPLTASHLHSTVGSSRSFTAIRKDAGLCCGSRLRKGEMFAYVGLPQNLKDLKSSTQEFRK